MEDMKFEDCPFMQLSKDLIFEIMYRLPVKSLGICALVCTTLNSVISDPKFRKAHVEFLKIYKEPLTLALKPDKIMATLEFNDCKDITKGVRLVDLRHQFLANEHADYICTMIGSCDGVVCIYLKSILNPEVKSNINDDLMFVWNPVTNECEEVELPDEVRKVYMKVNEHACCFGYLPSRNDYKIVLSYDYDRIYVYSFNTSSWREIPATNKVCSLFSWGLNPVFMGEALYFFIGGKLICKFNLVDETFEMMTIAICDEPYVTNAYHSMSLGLIGREDDCLRVVFVQCPVNVCDGEENPEQDKEKTLEVWMLKEYGNLNSLERQCRIGLPQGIIANIPIFVGFTYSGILCFQEEDGLRLIDPMDDPPSYAIASTYNFDRVYKVADYVESLISPFDLSA